MFLKVFSLALILAVCDAGDSNLKTSGRQKRLLFYDEEGNLVKTYKNPHTLDALHNAEKVPFLGSIFSMFRPQTLGVPSFYMIPVSDQVIQQINTDPVYQNKLLTLPRKDMVVEPNALCAGKRTQLPSKSCRNFLNCWDGWAFEQECPEGLLFAKEGYCDYPFNVDCASRTNEASPAPAATAVPPMPSAPVMMLTCSKDFESFRNKQKCNEFFICVDKSPVRFRCPADLAYNEELGVCDYAYRVNCGEAIISQDEGSQPQPGPACSSAPATPAVKPEPVGVLSPGSEGAPPIIDAKTVVNAEFNSQSWSSSHVAISRQDAIRQLQHGGT